MLRAKDNGKIYASKLYPSMKYKYLFMDAQRGIVTIENAPHKGRPQAVLRGPAACLTDGNGRITGYKTGGCLE